MRGNPLTLSDPPRVIPVGRAGRALAEVDRPLTFPVVQEAPSDGLPTRLRATGATSDLSAYGNRAVSPLAPEALRILCCLGTEPQRPQNVFRRVLYHRSCGFDGRCSNDPCALVRFELRAPSLPPESSPCSSKLRREFEPAISSFVDPLFWSGATSRGTSDRHLQPTLFSFQSRAPVPWPPIESIDLAPESTRFAR